MQGDFSCAVQLLIISLIPTRTWADTYSLLYAHQIYHLSFLIPSLCSLLCSPLSVCLSLTNTCTVTDIHIDTCTQWHISALLLVPEEAGKNGNIYPDLAYSEPKWKSGPLWRAGGLERPLYSLETKPGSVAWSGWLDLWIDPTIQQWQTPLTFLLWGSALTYMCHSLKEVTHVFCTRDRVGI